MTSEQIQLQLMKIFFPFTYEQIEKVRKKGTRFVHYTNAEAATKILKNREFWMRRSTCMNDFMEAEHGWGCLLQVYRDDDTRERFRNILNSLHSGLAQEFEDLINGWSHSLKNNSYIACLSEHLDSENYIGRLSMWRAYGRSIGVALVLNNTPFFDRSNALKVYASPVAYLNGADVEQKFKDAIDAMETNLVLLQGLDKNFLLRCLFDMFRFAIHAIKHPGFKEEREWRVIYSPEFDQSTRLVKGSYTIGGVPQAVYKIPLKNIPEEGFLGIEVPELFERIIIGPTDYPTVIMETFVDLLSECGVEKPAERVFVSDIPLR